MVHFIPRTTSFLLETKKIAYYFQALGSFVWCVWEQTGWQAKLTMTPGLLLFSGNFDTVYLETLKEFVCSLNWTEYLSFLGMFSTMEKY